MNINKTLAHAASVFAPKKTVTHKYVRPSGSAYNYRPYTNYLSISNARTVMNSILNRMALDVAQTNFKHVQLDDEGRYTEEISDSSINKLMNLSPNIDQTPRAFKQDLALSLFNNGAAAIVPTEIDVDIKTGIKQYLSFRVGIVKEWYPKDVKIECYNEETGEKEEIYMAKKDVAIIENPYYSIMNEGNSTLSRLTSKLSILDAIDEQSGAGKLDLIIQLPYVIKSESRKAQAETRRKDLEEQLMNGKYGIAYTDGSEKITQLNRSVDNNLMTQIEYLTQQLYTQLCITEGIMNGTASADEMNNYYNRTIEPIVTAITLEMKRKFLTDEQIENLESVEFFRDYFKLMSVNELPEIVDKFTRNEVLTTNEVRQIIGLKPSQDPGADELRNKNLSASTDETRINVDGEVIDNPAAPQNGQVQQEAPSPAITADTPVSQLM